MEKVFILSVAAVYLLLACVVARRLLRRAGLMSIPARGVLWAERATVALAAVGVLCFAYGFFVEPYWPEVTRTRITSEKLKGATRPVRVVHISDLHCDPRPRLEEHLPEIIRAERPDIIVYTGDSLNSPEGYPVLRNLLPRLAEIAPTFAVRGNWDVWYWKRIDLFGGTGVLELDGEAASLEVAGAKLSIAGAPYGDEEKIERAWSSAPADTFRLFLYHTPDLILDVADANRAELYCAGHTHGGQVALPFYGALITFSKFGKRYESGHYRERDTHLYVNRGIGMEGGQAPRVRFFARPEVTVIELAPD